MTLDELDRLAAEKVMGAVKLDIDPGVWCTNLEIINSIQFHDVLSPIEEWQPTRNIAQAWECLEKFEANQLFTRTKEVSPRHEAVVFTVDQLTAERVYFAEADSLPEAIVRACLRARGVEV